MLKRLKHFYRIFRKIIFTDAIKYYWIIRFRSGSDKSYKISFYNGLKLSMIPGSGDYCAFHEVFIREDYHFQDLGNPGKIVDIGANVGYFSLYASQKYPGAKIFSFEPFPPTYLRLKENLTSNKTSNVFAFQLAVSDKKGKADFFSVGWIGANTLNSGKFDGNMCEMTKVDTIPFHEIFEITGTESFDMAKIDCEGSEYPMLLNSTDESILKINKYVIEVHPDKNYKPSDLVTKFNRLGYKTILNRDILIAVQ